MKRLLPIAMMFACAVAHAQSTLSGTVINPDGSGFNGRLIFALAQNASASTVSPCTGPKLVVPTEQITVMVTAGNLVSPPTLTSSVCTIPVGVPYNVIAIDSNGNVDFTDQWLISGNPFNVGTAVSSGNAPTVSYKGLWGSTTTYTVGDIVGYGVSLNMYVSTVSNNVGNVPGVSTNWQELTGGGGGSSGFPIMLGSTVIGSGSTTAAVTGLSVNGVMLSATGVGTSYLDQTGNYSTPAGTSLVSFAAPSGSWPAWLVPTVTNSTTTPSLTVAASAIPNAALAYSALTVSTAGAASGGGSISLGGSLTITVGAGGIASVIQDQTGCSTVGYVWTPATNTCTVPGAAPITAVTGTAPVDCTTSGSTVNCLMAQATSSVDGYLSHIDWNVFNGKQAALGFTPYNATNPAGYITSSVTTLPSLSLPYSQVSGTPTVGTWGALNYPTWASGTPFVKMTADGTFALDTNTYLTAVTGTAPVDCTTSGSSVNCSMAQATSLVDGYLSHIDWAAFNGKQTALTNPVTGPGSGVIVGHQAVFGNTSGTSILDGGPTAVSITTYGAKFDGQTFFTGSMSLSSATLNVTGGDFASGDVGKVIDVYGAGAAGVRLITTISTVNSATQVVLAASASTAVSGATVDYGTDDTAAWKTAIAAAASGTCKCGGQLIVPPGMSVLNGALDTSQQGNAILAIPYVAVATPGPMETVALLGNGVGTAYPEVTVSDTPPVNTAIYAMSAPTGTNPAIIGGPSAGENFTSVTFGMRGITLRTPPNPAFTALNLQQITNAILDQVVADVNVNGLTIAVPAPTVTTSRAFMLPGIYNWGLVSLTNSYATGYYGCFEISEHANLFNDFGQQCHYGLQADAGTHLSTLTNLLLQENTIQIYDTGGLPVYGTIDFEDTGTTYDFSAPDLVGTLYLRLTRSAGQAFPTVNGSLSPVLNVNDLNSGWVNGTGNLQGGLAASFAGLGTAAPIVVTGTGGPTSPNGAYYYMGLFNDRPYYRMSPYTGSANTFYIYFGTANPIGEWCLGNAMPATQRTYDTACSTTLSGGIQWGNYSSAAPIPPSTTWAADNGNSGIATGSVTIQGGNNFSVNPGGAESIGFVGNTITITGSESPSVNGVYTYLGTQLSAGAAVHPYYSTVISGTTWYIFATQYYWCISRTNGPGANSCHQADSSGDYSTSNLTTTPPNSGWTAEEGFTGTPNVVFAANGYFAHQVDLHGNDTSTSYTIPACTSGTYVKADGTGCGTPSSGGTTTNALTFATSGGVAPTTTFDGSVARIADYHSIGASPLAGSSSLTTVGTLSAGSIPYSLLTGTPTVGTWGALNYPTWASGTPFVKMTAAGTFALDTNTYGTFTLPSLTSGSVLYSNGSTISQDNANFFWDATNHTLGIGTTNPRGVLHVYSRTSPAPNYYNGQLQVGGDFGALNDIVLSIGTDYTSGKIFIQGWNGGNGPANILLQPSGANVGIGTTTPTHTLEVNGTFQSGTATLGASSTASNGSTQQAICLADGTGCGVNTAATQTTVSCSTVGTATFSEPFTGASYKKVIYSVSGCQGTVSYTFPVAFTTGTVQLSPAGGANTVTNTSITWGSVSAQTAIGMIEGW